MNIEQKTKEVIINAIENRALKVGAKKSEIAITLYVESENKVGVVFLRNGQAEIKSSINSILGSYSLMPTVSSTVNNKIYNALKGFSEKLQASILTLNARLFIIEDELIANLYMNGELTKKILIEDILN